MDINEIPLTADNQQFSIVLAGKSYRLSIIWRDLYWILDLLDEQSNPIITGIPLVTGAELLAQYGYLGLGFKFAVVCDDPSQDYPTKTDLGSRSHLLVLTE